MTANRKVVLGFISIASLVGLAGDASGVLVAHWDMDEGTGATAASQVNSPDADALFFGDPSWSSHLLPPVPSGTTSSLLLDPVDDFLETNAMIGVPADNARTVAAWIRTGSDANQTIVDWGENATGARFTFRINNNGAQGTVGALRLEVSSGYAIGNGIVTDGQWHNVAVTFPAGGSVDDLLFYVDGALDADVGSFSGVLDLAINTTSAPIRIASRVGGSNYFDGVMDDVRVWDEQLGATAISALVPAGQLPTFAVEINRNTGQISVVNNYGTAVDEVIAYSLRSEIGALDSGSNWTTITGNYDASGNGSVDVNDEWTILTDTANPTYDDLSEFSPGGDGGAFADASSVSLGNAWLRNPIEDVTAELLFANGDRLPVTVEFFGNGGNSFEFGDLNFDGNIDADDWGVFRPNLLRDLLTLAPIAAYGLGDLDFDGDNDRDDFAQFKSIYEAENGPGSFSALLAGVPEPASAILLAPIVGCLVLGFRVRGYVREGWFGKGSETLR